MSDSSSLTLEQLVARTSGHFERRYGGLPQRVVAAPGRVNLIGEHVDYIDGFVLPMAIERYCVIAAGEINDATRMTNDEAQQPNDECRMTNVGQVDHLSFAATVFSSAAGEEAVISLSAPQRYPTTGHWSNYVAGVVAGCLERDMRPASFRAVIESNVPYGGGLSSSASLEVATATLLEDMTNHTLDPIEKALVCQRAEHTFADVPCGIMDQFASVMCRADHLMLLDCRSHEISHIPFADPDVTVLIINTNVKHELASGEYAERRGQCEATARKLGVPSLRDVTPATLALQRDQLSPVEFRRARHVVSEIARTTEAAQAVNSADWLELGRLMYSSHDSLRDDYEVSCRELDVLVDLARQLGTAGGVIGARMTGGGFGGCVVSVVRTAMAGMVARALAQSYRAAIGIEPSFIISRPARGAHVIHAVHGS